MKADIRVPEDRDETIDSMQPMKIGESSPRLPDVRDLAVDLAAKAARHWPTSFGP
jgi:hypothetical protein